MFITFSIIVRMYEDTNLKVRMVLSIEKERLVKYVFSSEVGMVSRLTVTENKRELVPSQHP